jgi:hypothetical protein
VSPKSEGGNSHKKKMIKLEDIQDNIGDDLESGKLEETLKIESNKNNQKLIKQEKIDAVEENNSGEGLESAKLEETPKNKRSSKKKNLVKLENKENVEENNNVKDSLDSGKQEEPLKFDEKIAADVIPENNKNYEVGLDSRKTEEPPKVEIKSEIITETPQMKRRKKKFEKLDAQRNLLKSLISDLKKDANYSQMLNGNQRYQKIKIEVEESDNHDSAETTDGFIPLVADSSQTNDNLIFNPEPPLQSAKPHGPFPLDCPKCKVILRDVSNFNSHMIDDHWKKDKKCGFCGKTKKIKFNFIVHLRIHSGEKPFRCQNCDDSFTQQNQLAKHQERKCNKMSVDQTSKAEVSKDQMDTEISKSNKKSKKELAKAKKSKSKQSKQKKSKVKVTSELTKIKPDSKTNYPLSKTSDLLSKNKTKNGKRIGRPPKNAEKLSKKKKNLKKKTSAKK